MASNIAAAGGRKLPGHHNLTPNERAIIDRVRIPAVKNVVTAVWRIKLDLQFTGWLQYLIPVAPGLALVLIAGLGLVLHSVTAAVVFASMAGLLFAADFFDLITVKCRLRPREHRPDRNDASGIFELMRQRRSCRSFQTRPMETADRDELLASVRRHSEEPKIGTAAVRFEYVCAPITVWPTVNAGEFLVAIAPKSYDRLAVIDVGYTLQKIVMDATRMGLGTCWIGPGADHESINRHLAERFDPQRDHIICVCAVGYPSRYIPLFVRTFTAQMHRRLPLCELFFADAQLKRPLDTSADPFHRFDRTIEACQWAPSSYNGQTTRCVAARARGNAGAAEGLLRYDFYASIESRYYAPVAVGIWCANWELACAALGIKGRFAVLADGERGINDESGAPPLPRYVVSWVLDERMPAGA